jgi:MFS family permease
MTAEPAQTNDFKAFTRLLGGGPFARYMLGEAISVTGTWMQIFAQSWLLTMLTDRAWVFGAIQFAGGIPVLALAMIGGSLADRMDKRMILHAVFTIQLILACLLGWLVASHQIAIWHVLLSAILLGVTAAFEMPTVSAFVPELVAKEDIARALAIDRSVFHFTRMIGPAIGGYLMGKFGVPLAYFLNGASFLALIWAVATIPRRSRGSEAEEEQRQGPMREGFDFVRRDAPTRAMVLLMGAITLCISPFLVVTMTLYGKKELGLDEEHIGWLMGVSGLGSFIGSIGLLRVHRGHRATFLKCALSVAVLGISILTSAYSFPVACIGMVMLTLGISSGFGTANIVIQERAPDAIRGRVSAVAGMAFFGALPFASVVVTLFADRVGLRTAMWCGIVLFSVFATLLLAGRRRLASAPPVS